MNEFLLELESFQKDPDFGHKKFLFSGLYLNTQSLLLFKVFVMKVLWYILISFIALSSYAQVHEIKPLKKETTTLKTGIKDSLPVWIHINRPVLIKDYFQFVDSIVSRYDTLVSYKLTEHLLVRANSRLIDTLAKTDFYYMMAQDSFVYDQKELIVIRAGDSIHLPASEKANSILSDFERTWIDINIPEYRLRVYKDSVELFSFPIRVGQNRKKYLAMGDRITDLRTKAGSGKIIRHERDPDFYNPTNGRQFYVTRRDNDSVTMMPQIPWIETEINGVRNGQMIHPTTNPETLQKAYSNGCVGTKEGDGWIIYYYAPINTPIKIRYELTVKDANGDPVLLKDIYNLRK
jgi:L,D-transpeptidase ErfK/SrfK